MTKENITYCDLKNFSELFHEYNKYLVFIVCIFGCILNCFNICVLTRKQMRCPTNFILTSLAVTDLLVMLEYMPFSYLYAKQPYEYLEYYYSYYFTLYLIFHAMYTQSFHFISCCLTIILALWRYIAVKFPQNNNKWCGPRRTKWTILFTYILCPLICAPVMIILTVDKKPGKVDSNLKILDENADQTNASDVVLHHVSYRNNIFTSITMLFYGIVLKLVPCILLTILSFLLIYELFEAKRRTKKLMTPVVTEVNGVLKKKMSPRQLEKEKQAYRTTQMLLAVLLLFLLVEFPQAIFGVLAHVKGFVFEKECYQPLGDLMDLIAMMAGAINFFLYCVMSQKFRKVFQQIFFARFMTSKNQWLSLDTMVTRLHAV